MHGRAAACAVVLAIVASDRAADAQLHSSADRLAAAWRGVGAAVVVDPPRFLNDDETLAVALPDPPDRTAEPCTTVVFLGARGLSFHARLDSHDDDPNGRLASEAGALSIERCGDALPDRVLVTSDSGRGAIETIVARSARPLESLRTILPERTGGSPGTPPEPGLMPPLPAPGKRAEAAEARARRDGATIGRRQVWPAGPDGGGAAEDALAPGCHTFELFAVDLRATDPGRPGRLDLDAEMRDASGDRILARDRSDAPDARLDVCVGDATHVEVAFVGSPPGAPVLVTHVAWPIPDHLPTAWGSEGRARMAHVLQTRHTRSLLGEPVLLAQGGSGTTPVPFAIEPGACYLALASVVQGAARDVDLRVHVGTHDAFDDRGVDEEGAVVAFCAGDRTSASAELEARGTPLLGWGLALYRVAHGAWEMPR